MKLIDTHLGEYLEHLRSRELAPGTIKQRREAITDFALTTKTVCPEIVTVEHIREYERALTQRKLATSTRRGKLSAIRDFLSYLRDEGFVLFDASTLMHLPRPEKIIPRNILTEQDMARIFSVPTLNSGKGMRLRALVEILYGSGIRRSELLKLDLYDIDMKERTLLVRQGKGRKDRLLPLPRTTLEYVKKYIERVRSRRQRGNRVLLLTSKGARLDDNGLQTSIYRLGKIARDRLGIKKRITCHVFRHSIATHLVQRGVDIRYVQAFLGHADLSSTQIYTRVAVSEAARELVRCHPRDKMKIPLK